MNKRWIFLSACTLWALTRLAHADIIPSDRLVNWEGTVGVEGGIPSRTTVRNCVASDGVPTNETSDATAAIRNCLTNTPSGQAAFLPAGTYKISGTITIPANKTLRGAGAKLTILSNTSSGLDNVIFIGAGSPSSTLLPISSGYTKDSTQIVLADASSFSVGNYVLLNELNDTSIPVTPQSNAAGEGACNWCDQFGATRLRAQVNKVTAKSGNTLTLAQPLFYTFSGSRDPRVMKLNTLTEYAGLESLTVSNESSSIGGWLVNIMIRGAANCWVKDVVVDNCGKRCVDLRTYFYRVEVRDSLITHCIDHSNSDTCYGTEVAEGSNSLIENNVYDDTSNGPILMWGASGNVVAYNYMHSVFRTYQSTSWMWPNTWSHGAHPSFNLWEGNHGSALNWDGYWGSASHNTAFRNRFTSKDPAQPLASGHVEDAALLVEVNNNYNNVVGNVLGLAGWSNGYEQRRTRYWSENLIYALSTPDIGDDRSFTTMLRHRNYDYFTNSTKNCTDSGEPGCQGGDASTTLPPSFYLSAKPAWFGSVAWPPIGPDVSGLFNKTPAQVCFEQGAMPNCFASGTPSDSTPPTVSLTSHSSGATLSGTVTLTASASDPESGVASVRFRRGSNVNIGSLDTASPYSVSWNTAQVANGTYSLTVIATNNANLSATSTPITVTVSNAVSNPDTTAPTVSFTSPQNNATLSGALNLSASASDAQSGVASVQFQIDGSDLGLEDTASPFTLFWNSSGIPNGLHTLRAIATDNAGNSNTAQISVTVNNTGTSGSQSAPPFVNSFNPAKGGSVDIPFILNGSGHVKVTVYDRKGREIKILKDEDTVSGTAHWDGKNTDGSTVASGVYHVFINAAGNKSTEKVVVVK